MQKFVMFAALCVMLGLALATPVKAGKTSEALQAKAQVQKTLDAAVKASESSEAPRTMEQTQETASEVVAQVANFRAGDAVWIYTDNGRWYAGTILRVGTDIYYCTFDGFPRSNDQWVYSRDLRLR